MTWQIRLFFTLAFNIAFGLLGFALGAFDISGLLFGVGAGFLVTYAFGIRGFLVLASFVLIGSVTTRIGYSTKMARGISEPKGGRRTWRSAFGNLTVAALSAALDISNPSQLFSIAMVAAFAAATFDTVASEIGKAFAKRVITLTDFSICEPGVSGGISLQGSIGGLLASLLVAIIASSLGLLKYGGSSQVGVAGYVVIAAVIGSMAESVLKSGLGVRSGQVCNLTNTAIGAVLAVLLVRYVGGS